MTGRFYPHYLEAMNYWVVCDRQRRPGQTFDRCVQYGYRSKAGAAKAAARLERKVTDHV